MGTGASASLRACGRAESAHISRQLPAEAQLTARPTSPLSTGSWSRRTPRPGKSPRTAPTAHVYWVNSRGRRNTHQREVAMKPKRLRRSDRALRPPMSSPGRPPGWRREHRVRYWEAISHGLSSESAAETAGVSPAVGTRWSREGGGMSTLDLVPVSGRYLSFAEREEIAILHAREHTARDIARRMCRSPSTISRDLPGAGPLADAHPDGNRALGYASPTEVVPARGCSKTLPPLRATCEHRQAITCSMQKTEHAPSYCVPVTKWVSAVWAAELLS